MLAPVIAGRLEARARTPWSDDLSAAEASLTANGQCIDDITQRQNVCEANDVAITEMRVVQLLDSCTFPGDTATVLFRLRIEATADRYDVGLFIANDGGDARTGDCRHDFLPPPLAFPCCYDATSGVGPFLDAEDIPGSGDECGDIENGVQTFYILQVPIQVACVDLDGDGAVDVGTCTSWDNNQNNLCQSIADAIPGTVAKCRCERINVNIPVMDEPPSCLAGGPYVSECRDVLIDGATVSDPEDGELTYDWQSSNPAVTVVPAAGTIPAGTGLRSVPPATAFLSANEDPCNFTAQLTMTVTDEAGNSSTCQATVGFDDRTPPLLSAIPPDATVECDAVPPPANPTASDNCDPDPEITFSESRTDGSCPDSYSLVRTWTATDHCGNLTSGTQTITVHDTVAPVLSGVPGDMTVQCDAVPPPASPTASDNCDPDPEITFTESRTDGSCPDRYTLERTWTVTDRCGNSTSGTQTITVHDTVAPILSGVPGDVTVQCDAVPPPASPTASDNCDPDPEITFSETRTDGSCPDRYTLGRTWTATDRCGNSTTASQIITVQDTVAPVLSGVPGDLTVQCDAVPPPASPTASDNCDPAPVISFSESRTDGSCPDSYTLVRTWTATDRCGNSTSATQTIVVHDTMAPVLSGVPGDATVQCDAVPPPANPTASDNCDPAPAISFSESRTDGSCPDNYTLVRTWTATDRCGNSTSATQTIVVQDTMAPVLSGVPADVTAECDAVPSPANPTASDNCDPAPVIGFSETHQPGNCPGDYTLVRTWTASDRCGNSTAASQTVTIRDTTPPTVEPGRANLACIWPPNHWYVCFTPEQFQPVVDDNCSEPVTWRFAGCASDQPDEAPDPAWPGWNGDGNTTEDCVVLPEGRGICVRAERCGTGPTAQFGRHYGVAVVASDACGNESDPTVIGTIHVPHDQSPHERPCLDPTKVGCRPNQPIPCPARR